MLERFFGRFGRKAGGLAARAAALILSAASLLAPVPVQAAGSGGATPVGDNTAWIRAKLTYEYDEGITGLSDSIVEFEDKWMKSGGWYYYKDPVNPGDRVRFIKGFKVPETWDNSMIDKNFRIIVTVEGSEVAPGDTGWDSNSEVAFSKTFDLWNKGYQHDEDVWVEEGKLTVDIHEYQLDANGNEVEYVNDKVITPGQKVSKIVEFEIGGKKGRSEKLIPEKPVKDVKVAGVSVDGKNVNAGTILNYEITVKNPAPDRREIVITDVVDGRLTVVDTKGGTFIDDPSDDGTGGTLEWRVWVDGKQSATVFFDAKLSESIDASDVAVPNTADALIVGKAVKSNTVVVGFGNPSAIRKAIARATGDPARFVAAAVLASTLVILSVTLLVALARRKKDEEQGSGKGKGNRR